MHRGIPKLIVESDCLTIVESISSMELPNSELGNIILDIRALMSHFLTCKIQHGNKNCNYAAHKLARNAWSVEDVVLLYKEMPNFLEQTI